MCVHNRHMCWAQGEGGHWHVVWPVWMQQSASTTPCCIHNDSSKRAGRQHVALQERGGWVGEGMDGWIGAGGRAHQYKRFGLLRRRWLDQLKGGACLSSNGLCSASGGDRCTLLVYTTTDNAAVDLAAPRGGRWLRVWQSRLCHHSRGEVGLSPGRCTAKQAQPAPPRRPGAAAGPCVG